MHRRRLTARARSEDLVGLRPDEVRQLAAWLVEDTAEPSRREALSCAHVRSVGERRADTFTYHQSTGRGAQWRQTDPECLWLLCYSSGHDAGYDHACVLLRDRRLYPELPDDEEARREDQDIHEFVGECLRVLRGLRAAGKGVQAADYGGYWARFELVPPGGWLVEVRRNKIAAASHDRWLVPGEWLKIIASLFETPSIDWADEAPAHLTYPVLAEIVRDERSWNLEQATTHLLLDS